MSKKHPYPIGHLRLFGMVPGSEIRIFCEGKLVDEDEADSRGEYDSQYYDRSGTRVVVINVIHQQYVFTSVQWKLEPNKKVTDVHIKQVIDRNYAAI